MQFERNRRRKPINLNLTSLIDVLFILIIFFMLTTSFMRIESLELILPSAAGPASADSDIIHLYISADGDMSLGKRSVDKEALRETLSKMFTKDSETKVMLLTADGVSLQQLVDVMDQVYLSGGKSLMVRKWQAGS